MCCLLFVVYCWLFVVGVCSLLAVDGCLVFVVCCVLFVCSCCLLLVVVVCCPLVFLFDGGVFCFRCWWWSLAVAGVVFVCWCLLFVTNVC